MEFTVKIDSSTATGKRLLEELKRYPKIVQFENPAVTGVAPAGYVTLDEFKEWADERVKDFCAVNGIY